MSVKNMVKNRKPYWDDAHKKLSKATGEPVGVFPEILMTLITSFLPMLLKALPCLNPKPVPVDPDPSPTPEKALAWENAWKLKGRAEEAKKAGGGYNKATVNQMARQIKKQKKHDGEPVDRGHSVELAIQALDKANETPHEELVEMILEAQAD